MEGTDICCEIERRVSDGFVYSEAVTRYARPVQACVLSAVAVVLLKQIKLVSYVLIASCIVCWQF